MLDGDIGLQIPPTPEHPRGGGLAAIENDRFLVTLFGILGDYPPTDPQGFADFASTLHFPDINEAMRDGSHSTIPWGSGTPSASGTATNGSPDFPRASW